MTLPYRSPGATGSTSECASSLKSSITVSCNRVAKASNNIKIREVFRKAGDSVLAGLISLPGGAILCH